MSDRSQLRMPATAADDRQGWELQADETLVDLRCSVIIFRRDEVLLLHRIDADEWVLPGGRPRPGESMVSCANADLNRSGP